MKYINNFWQKIYDVRSQSSQIKYVWFSFISIAWVHDSHKSEKFSLKSHKNTLIFFWHKSIWRHIWIYPTGKCLILLHLHFFGFTLVIKLKNFDFQSHWNILILLGKKICGVRFDMGHGKCLILFHFYCLDSL